MEKQLRQQAVIFLMFSLRVHKKSKVEKERRKAEAEEKKKNAKFKPKQKPAGKKSTITAIAPKTMGLASTLQTQKSSITPGKADDLSKTLNSKLNLQDYSRQDSIAGEDLEESSRTATGLADEAGQLENDEVRVEDEIELKEDKDYFDD